MYGLEKKKPQRFQFDLEKKIAKSNKEKTTILNQINKQLNQLKTILREGQASDNFDQSVVLLQAYTVLERVIIKASKTR